MGGKNRRRTPEMGPFLGLGAIRNAVSSTHNRCWSPAIMFADGLSDNALMEIVS